MFDKYLPSSLELETDHYLLRNLTPGDINALWAISQEPSLWNYFTRKLNEMDELEAWVKEAIEQQQRQIRFPFVVIDRLNNQICGSTSFGNISFHDSRVEIGWTWYGKQFHGTGINSHCKFLLTRYAFENMFMERVELKTDCLNKRARAAIKKIGYIEEGILRSHMLMPGGRRRDSVYSSMLKEEWLPAKEKLLKIIYSSHTSF